MISVCQSVSDLWSVSAWYVNSSIRVSENNYCSDLLSLGVRPHEPKCTKIWPEKVLELGPIWLTLGPNLNLTILGSSSAFMIISWNETDLTPLVPSWRRHSGRVTCEWGLGWHIWHPNWVLNFPSLSEEKRSDVLSLGVSHMTSLLSCLFHLPLSDTLISQWKISSWKFSPKNWSL